MKIVTLPVVTAALSLATPAKVALAAPVSPCAKPAPAINEIGNAIRAFFAALAADDAAALHRLTTPDFYAFDVGKRYTAAKLSKAIADAHKTGRIIQWNVGQVDTRIDCNRAFAAWENKGAAGTKDQLRPREWLESASLIRKGDRWLIDFLHSTPKDPRQ